MSILEDKVLKVIAGKDNHDLGKWIVGMETCFTFKTRIGWNDDNLIERGIGLEKFTYFGDGFPMAP